MSPSEARLHQLFLLNLALQLFDGVATWQGFAFFGEGNPLLVRLLPYLGIGVTVLLFKVKACGFLVVLRRCWQRREAHAALALLATFYGVFSFTPWMVRLVSLMRA
jgi:hypothetical protein